MTDVLLPVVLLISIVTLAIAIGTLRSSRRSEGLGEDRYELLRNQHNWLEALREERTMLMEALQRETSERQTLMESFREADPRLTEDLARDRQDNVHRAELQEQERVRLEKELEHEREEQSRVQQEAERLRQERKRLAEDLERERVERPEVQRQAERQVQELARLKQELRQSQAELDRRRRAPASNQPDKSGAGRPWWRRPIPVVGLLLGVLIAWFTSLAVALNMLAP